MAGLFSAKTVSAPPAASWPNACAPFARCRKANRFGAPDAASSSALICRRRGDESHFNPSCWFLIRASSRRLLRYGEFENWAVIALGGIGRDAAAPSGHRSAMTLPAPRRASSRNPPFSSVSRPSARRFRRGDVQFDDRQGYFRRGQG